MTSLPSYPKGNKTGCFVSLSSKSKIFQASSYDSLNPVINIDPPAVNPGLEVKPQYSLRLKIKCNDWLLVDTRFILSLRPGFRDIMKPASSEPTSQSIQFSTLKNWEKFARSGKQVSSHSELFLFGTL